MANYETMAKYMGDGVVLQKITSEFPISSISRDLTSFFTLSPKPLPFDFSENKEQRGRCLGFYSQRKIMHRGAKYSQPVQAFTVKTESLHHCPLDSASRTSITSSWSPYTFWRQVESHDCPCPSSMGLLSFWFCRVTSTLAYINILLCIFLVF